MSAGIRVATEDLKPLALDELHRVLEQGLGGASERQRNLLSYLVTEELEGRGGRIKAYSIATQVLNRSEDFDAQTDSIVRVEVGRLRQALERYYLGAGAGAQLRISIPKGQYRPNFARGGVVPAPRFGRLIAAVALCAAALVGSLLVFVGSKGLLHQGATSERKASLVAVAPFVFTADKDSLAYVAAGLQAELAATLSEFSWLSVVPLTADTARRVEENPKALDADFLLRTTARLVNDRLAATVLLADGRTGAVVWSRNYDLRFDAQDILSMQRDIAARIAADVAHPSGAIVNIERTRLDLDAFKTDEGFRCQLQAMQFGASFAREDYVRARDCFVAIRAREPPDANSLAALALLQLAPGAALYDPRPRGEVVAEASRLAEKAFDLDRLALLPRAARYSAALCAGDVRAFRAIGAEVIADYPNNPLLLTDFGSKLVLATWETEEGLALLARAREISSRLMPIDAVAPAIVALRKGEAADLAVLREAAGRSASPAVALVYLAAARSLGDAAEISRAEAHLRGLGADVNEDPARLTHGLCWSREAREAVMGALAKGVRKQAATPE